MPSEQPYDSSFDRRPSRSQVEALLGEVTRERATLQALVDAFQAHGLLSGTPHERRPVAYNGRFPRGDVIHALDDFGQNLRDQVIAVLEKVGVSPNDATPCGREKLVEYSNRTRFLRSHSHPYRVHHLSYPNSCRLKAQLDQVSL
jgi:hypothetical protein